MQEIFKLSEEEYLEICRQKYRSMSEEEQNKIALKKAVDVLSEMAVKNKFQGMDFNDKERVIKTMTQSLHSAIYTVIRCALGVKTTYFIGYDRVPKAIAIANKVANIISEGA